MGEGGGGGGSVIIFALRDSRSFGDMKVREEEGIRKEGRGGGDLERDERESVEEEEGEGVWPFGVIIT